MASFWRLEKELFCDTFTAYFKFHRHSIEIFDHSTVANLLDEIKLLICLGTDLYNGDWEDFFHDIDAPKQLAKAINTAREKADELTVTNPNGINADISSLTTLLDQCYCVNGIWPGTPLAKALKNIIRTAQREQTPYTYYYYLLDSYKIELNKLNPVNPLKPF